MLYTWDVIRNLSLRGLLQNFPIYCLQLPFERGVVEVSAALG